MPKRKKRNNYLISQEETEAFFKFLFKQFDNFVWFLKKSEIAEEQEEEIRTRGSVLSFIFHFSVFNFLLWFLADLSRVNFVLNLKYGYFHFLALLLLFSIELINSAAWLSIMLKEIWRTLKIKKIKSFIVFNDDEKLFK